MPIPPNYRYAGTESNSCSFCVNFRNYKTRAICLKHLSYVLLTRTCDDWKLGEGPSARFGLQRKELDESEMKTVSSVQLTDPHRLPVKLLSSYEDIDSR